MVRVRQMFFEKKKVTHDHDRIKIYNYTKLRLFARFLFLGLIYKCNSKRPQKGQQYVNHGEQLLQKQDYANQEKEMARPGSVCNGTNNFIRYVILSD